MFKEKSDDPSYLIYYNNKKNNNGRSFVSRRRRASQIFKALLVLLAAVGSLFLFLWTSASDPDTSPATQLRLDPIPTPSCANISESHLQRLRNAGQSVIATFADGEPISSDYSLKTPQAICILVVVPQRQPEVWYDIPTKGKGPDTIHLLLTSEDITLTFPPLLPLPLRAEGITASNETVTEESQAAESVIYHAETVLLHPGSYSISAEHEWNEWKWAQEWSWVTEEEFFQYKSGFQAKGGLAGVYWFEPKAFETNMMFPHTITIRGADAAPPRPICDNTRTASNGRWYNASAFPGIQPELIDEWGYSWEGDDCRIDYYNQDDIFDCLSDKVIHVFGDSMLRRQVKTLLAGGRWCLNPHDKCQTEDDRDEVAVTKLVHLPSGAIVEQNEERQHFRETGTAPIQFGKNSTLYFTFSGSLITGPHAWVPALFDSDRIFSDGTSWALDPTARARPPPEMLPADLVLFGIGAWDSALDESFETFSAQLPQFHRAFMQAYGGEGVDYDNDGEIEHDNIDDASGTSMVSSTSKPPPLMAMRLGNSYCCRGTDLLYRRYTGTRVQHTDDLIREEFRVDPEHGATAMDGRVFVVDPRNMNGRWDVIKDYGGAPGNNHPRASHVRIETQMLLNSVCERDRSTGKARLRKTPGVGKTKKRHAEAERGVGVGALKS